MFYPANMKRILIATDFSIHSKHSIQCVLKHLHDTQTPSQLLLLNTFIVQQTDPARVILENDELKKRSKAGLEQERIEALKLVKSPDVSIETASHMGSLNNVIAQLVHKEKYDLVAMGRDGGRHVASVSALLKQLHFPLFITYL